MDNRYNLLAMKKLYPPWILCALLSLAYIYALPHPTLATDDVPASSKETTPTIRSPKASQKILQEGIKNVISEIEDEDLRYFITQLYLTARNPYPEVNLDIWLRKAIEENHHALPIVKFLTAKGMIHTSLPWFSKIDEQFRAELPMHRAAYLGKIDIVKFLLQQGVTRYDPNDMFLWAIKGTHPAMVRLLLKKKIFDEEQLYGSLPSILPQVICALLFGFLIPVALWALHKYQGLILHKPAVKYLPIASFGIAILILLYLFINITCENTEGIGYLHILATLPLHDDPQGIKAKKISKIAQILLKHGANPNQKGSYIQELGVQEIQQVEGFTPLHGAVRRGNLPLVKVLMHYNADVNARAVLKSLSRDSTISGLEENDLVIYLPFFGNPESKTLEVCTPLDYALKENQKEIYRYLQSLQGPYKAKHYKDLFNFLV